MKITQILYKQHLGRMIRTLWHIKRERKIVSTKTEECLTKFGITVKDPTEVFPKKEKQRYFFLIVSVSYIQILHIYYGLLFVIELR